MLESRCKKLFDLYLVDRTRFCRVTNFIQPINGIRLCHLKLCLPPSISRCILLIYMVACSVVDHVKDQSIIPRKVSKKPSRKVKKVDQSVHFFF